MLPIERPGKIVCVGLNYRSHAEEQNRTPPERPMLFAKWATSLIGPGEPIVLPSISSAVDYEAELALVIGERLKGVSVENALEGVRGYLCANDVSARDLQRADKQYTRGKSLDTFCPVGPRARAGGRRARSGCAADPLPRQRRGAPGLDDGRPDLPRRRADRLHGRGDHARAGRSAADRHAVRAWGSSATRRSTSPTATS